MKKSSLGAWLFTVAVAVLLAPTSYADQITGSTTGCFASFNGNTATCGTTAQDAFLTFNQGSFSGLTDNTGFLAIGGTSGTFGSFSLTTGTANYAGDMFLLNLAITQPGNGSNSVVAQLHGDVTALAGGGIDISFTNPTSITLSTGQLLTFNVNSVDIGLGAGSVGNATITGNAILSGLSATAPEPSAMLLLGAGLLSIGGMRRHWFKRAAFDN
jgi:hypothetical protein